MFQVCTGGLVDQKIVQNYMGVQKNKTKDIPETGIANEQDGGWCLGASGKQEN